MEGCGILVDSKVSLKLIQDEGVGARVVEQ